MLPEFIDQGLDPQRDLAIVMLSFAEPNFQVPRKSWNNTVIDNAGVRCSGSYTMNGGREAL